MSGTSSNNKTHTPSAERNKTEYDGWQTATSGSGARSDTGKYARPNPTDTPHSNSGTPDKWSKCQRRRNFVTRWDTSHEGDKKISVSRPTTTGNKRKVFKRIPRRVQPVTVRGQEATHRGKETDTL